MDVVIFKLKYKFSGNKVAEKNNDEDLKKLLEWRREFNINRKKEKSIKKRNIALTFLILICILIFGYFWFTGELKFIGHPVNYATAKVVNTKMHHIGRGNYMQTVTYKFEYENKIYTSTFEVGQGIGKQENGNLLKVKFSTSNPNVSKFINVIPK